MISNFDLNRLSNLLQKVQKGKAVSRTDITWAISFVESIKSKNILALRKRMLQNEEVSPS